MGVKKEGSDQTIDPVIEFEIFKPVTENWEKIFSMTIHRLCYVTVLLLYDGSVITTGTD